VLFRSRTIEVADVTNDTVRPSYVGSRVEPYARHCGNAHCFDINSSFPYAMLEPQPAELLTIGRHLPKRLDTACFCAELEVSVPETYLPPLPMRTKDSRIYFPHGTWRGWFMSPDVRLLLERGCQVAKVHQCLNFDTFTDLGDYAQDIYEKRLKAKEAGIVYLIEQYKLLGNGCYGKFAEGRTKTGILLNPERPGECPHDPPCPDRGDGNGPTCLEMLFPGCWLVTHEEEIRHEHVAIASNITSIARGNLARHMYRAIDHQHRVYYCDTDGFLTDMAFPTSKELGGLKLEREVKRGIFVAPKLYMLETGDGKAPVCKAKGFSKMTARRFASILEGEPVEVERMSRIRELYRRGQVKPEERTILKELRGAVQSKRCYIHDGADSRPWHVSEIQ
jgi:hypothetical protein